MPSEPNKLMRSVERYLEDVGFENDLHRLQNKILKKLMNFMPNLLYQKFDL